MRVTEHHRAWSRAEIATTTDGAYIPAGTKQVDMSDVYHSYIERVEQAKFETARVNQYEARYQWFLAPALLLLLLEIALTTWPARRRAAAQTAELRAANPADPLERISHQSNETVVAA